MSEIQVVKGLKLKITRTSNATRESKYPWDTLVDLEDGFQVPADVSPKGFRSLALQQGKKRGKVFSVIRDADKNYWCVFTKVRTAEDEAADAEATPADEGQDEAMADAEAAVEAQY